MIMSNLTTSRTENYNSSVGSIEYSLASVFILYQDGSQKRGQHTLRSTMVSAQATLIPSALGNPHNGFEVISPSYSSSHSSPHGPFTASAGKTNERGSLRSHYPGLDLFYTVSCFLLGNEVPTILYQSALSEKGSAQPSVDCSRCGMLKKYEMHSGFPCTRSVPEEV